MDKLIFAILSSGCVSGIVLAYWEEMREIMPWERIKRSRENCQKALALWIVRQNREAPDRELFKSSIILKNLALVKRETPFSADFIYEKLMDNSELLKPMYGEMLTLYRNGRDEEAFKIPALLIKSKMAKHFGMILAKLDKLNPAELVEQMDIFQKTMLENRMTYSVKKAQRNSVIMTSIAAVSVFMLMINFTVVVVFMDSLRMLGTMF